MKCLVTGGAGFIGSELCRALYGAGHEITILDDLSSGTLANAQALLGLGDRIRFVKGDCANPHDVRASLAGVETVYHFAANPEIRLDRSNSSDCYNANIFATYVLLEQLKDSEVETVVIASSSSIYGEPKLIPTPENYGPLEPISIYGASKLACEAMTSAYAHIFGKTGIILRLANIVGANSKHGIIPDFMRQIKYDPHELVILGDGGQIKSYLYINDCISAILQAVDYSTDDINVFNIGSEDQVDVKRIATIVANEAGLDDLSFKFRVGARDGGGWKGDVKNMLLDIGKLRSSGWKPKYSSEEAVRATVRVLTHEDVVPLESSNVVPP